MWLGCYPISTLGFKCQDWGWQEIWCLVLKFRLVFLFTWRILWQRLRTSRSLQMSFTSSKMISFSSSDLSSFRFRRNGLIVLLMRACVSSLVGWVKNVTVPSTLVTSGRSRPPFSNSWAEILRTGVAIPVFPLLPSCSCWPLGEIVSVSEEEAADAPALGSECDTSHSSTIGRVAFLHNTMETCN